MVVSVPESELLLSLSEVVPRLSVLVKSSSDSLSLLELLLELLVDWSVLDSLVVEFSVALADWARSRCTVTPVVAITAAISALPVQTRVRRRTARAPLRLISTPVVPTCSDDFTMAVASVRVLWPCHDATVGFGILSPTQTLHFA